MRTFAGRQPFNGAFRSAHAPYGTRNRCSLPSPVPCPPSSRAPRPRKGVVLLIVLSLLALFVLLGVTYTLGVTQYYNASRNNLAVGRLGDLPEVETGAVLGSLLFDVFSNSSTTYTTSMQGHSILGDLYGIDGIAGVISGTPAAATGTQGQFLQFTTNAAPAVAKDQPYNQTLSAWSPIPEYYVGRVLTFTSGRCQGISTRITRYVPSTTAPTFCVEAPQNSKLPADTDQFLINGAPFNGTGFGFDSTAFNLTQVAAVAPTALGGNPAHTALLPHFGGYPAGGSNPMFYASQNGGMDESHDAPNNQNIFMAMVPPGRATGGALPVLPSFHRPELLPYWSGKMTSPYVDGFGVPDVTNADTKNFLRQFIFRPMIWDHPNFTGSNPAMDTAAKALNNMSNAQGVWDVDNDNDGVPDSIWIDPGLPIITTPDGRRVKRLAAILVKDLDGRINVNVHGHPLQWTQDTNSLEFHRTNRTVTSPYFAGQSGSGTALYLPRGFGFGPAEVDFQSIFGGTTGLTAYQNVIRGRYASRGEATAVPGVTGNDPLSQFRNFDIPGNHTTTYYTNWASPPDVWGRGIVALDYFGQPYYFAQPDFTATDDLALGETNDDPYEVQFDHTRALSDSPYQPRELERLLRYHDRDAQSLDSRLLYNSVTGGVLGSTTSPERPGEISTTTTTHSRREMLSTIGSYIPVGPGALMKEHRATFGTGPVTGGKSIGGAGYNTILDLYHNKIGNNPATFYTLVPFEMRHGELFNINRPFGNGLDDNSNYIADDATELNTPESMTTPNGNVTMEKFNDSHGLPLPADPRQIYARHLYCLMMLLKDNPATPWVPSVDIDGVTPGTPNDSDTARLIAQWAVNVVDFRDPDSIMTRFDYDPTPFDGWSPSTYVWGVERPELLITETLAFHDLRTENLATETPNMGQTAAQVGPGANDDTDFDQRLRPIGSCFIELYNPWHDATATSANSYNGMQHVPPELYTSFTGSGGPTVGVDLDRMVVDGTTGLGSPVWRLVVVGGTSHTTLNTGAGSTANPDLPTPNAGIAASDVTRLVFFADPTDHLTSTDPLMADSRKVYFSGLGRTTMSATSSLSLLGAGQYAVVGASGYDDGAGKYTTYVGRKTTDLSDADYMTSRSTIRQIVLNPGQQRNTGNSSSSEFEVKYNSIAANEILGFSKSPVAIPINKRADDATKVRSFNVSEPISYPATVLTSTLVESTDPYQDAYTPPIDTPLDSNNGLTDVTLSIPGSYAGVRTVILQRLADPTKAWHATDNPYLTIDRSSIDITSFSGTVAASDPSVTAITRDFQSFQRGGSYPPVTAGDPTWDNPGTPDQLRQLWPFATPRNNTPPAASRPEPSVVGPHNFPRQMLHTLGFLNSRYGTPISGSVAFSGAPQPQAATADLPDMYMSFPWLTFHNRPFMNPMELMLVPATNQYGLLLNFGMKGIVAAPTNAEYDSSVFSYPFGHLLNFFPSSNTAGAASQFCRLFDFVNVPSPYLQADSFYNAAQFSSYAGGGSPAADHMKAPFSYRPPFQKLSRFRDPGRVNINTVFDDTSSTAADGILKALFKSNPSMDPSNIDNRGNSTTLATNLRANRQGYAGGAYTANTTYPSMFYNPFRAQDASDLAVGGAITASAPVAAGFLRPQTTTTAPSGEPLFAYHSIGVTGGGATSYDYEDTNRNPYFRYQRYQKAGNLLSTQSNCFAIWITIGYFEVEDNTGTPKIDAAHPEGLSLAQEAGADSGQAVRHRAFFMIDRSIPVGFLPGSKLNTDNCILIRRMID